MTQKFVKLSAPVTPTSRLTRRAVLSLFALLGASLPMVIAGCGDNTASGGTTTTGGETTTGGAMATQDTTTTGGGAGAVTGTLTIKGSDTLLPLAQAWAEQFKKKNPGADITVTGGGSGQGITGLINGTCDIADSSRPAKSKEKEQGKAKNVEITETEVARDGITIVVHPSNPIKSLTLTQLGDIYKGKINNWNEVGGPDLKIVPSGRDTASGTYAYFQEDVLGKEKYRADMISTPSNNAIANNVAGQQGGIGYIGVAYATEFTKAGKVKEVPIAFKTGETAVLPTPENILDGKYPISRALYNYTNGAPSGLAKSYLDYVVSPDGQKIVKDQGFVTLK